MKVKKILPLVIAALLCIQGCGGKSKKENTSETDSSNKIEIETIDPSPIDNLELPGNSKDMNYQVADNVDDELTDIEKLFCIDINKRKEMINKFGEETYWTGVNAASLMWQTQTNKTSKITDKNLSTYDSKYKVQTVELKSTLDGHIIPADYITQDDDKNKDTIIFIHGANENRRNFTVLIKTFLDRGLNVLAYDQRSAGDNTARLCTYGEYEQYDLQQYINYIDDLIDNDHKIYIYARSQGGCTAGRVLGSENGNKKLDGAILDCPLSSMRWIMEKNMNALGLGNQVSEFIDASDKITDYLFGFKVSDCEIPQYIQNTTVPTLVITSECDSIVNKELPISLYDAIKGKKYLYVSQEAIHCNIQSFDCDEYDDLIDKFLSNELFK